MSAWELVTLMGGVFVGSFLAGTLENADQDTARQLLALPYADHPDFDESWRP